MDDMSAFERRLAAGLNAYAGPRRAVDALGVVRSARARSSAGPTLLRRALGPARRPWAGWAMRTTVSLTVIVVMIALLTALLVVVGATRPTPTPTPPAVINGALAIERYTADPLGLPAPHGLVLVADDGTVSPLTPLDREEACPTFSPDGAWLTFLSAPRRVVDGTDPVYELAVADPVVGAPRTFLMPGFRPPQEVSPPSWAPDGSALVAVLRAPDEPVPLHGDLLVIPVDGSPPRTLVRSPRVPMGQPAAGLSRLEGASWSPDGEWIAFRGERNDGDGWRYFVAVVRPDGTDLRLLDTWQRSGSGEWGGVVWAPDSRSIAYHRKMGMMDVYVASLADGTIRALPARGNQFVAEWSPDGTQIATVGLSRDPVQILDAVSGEIAASFDINAGAATWSARGDQLAIQDFDGRLWLTPADGSAQAELLAEGAYPLCGGMGAAISWQELRPVTE